jgi:hypothetical protein
LLPLPYIPSDATVAMCMNNIIDSVGAIVIVIAVLSFFGLR